MHTHKTHTHIYIVQCTLYIVQCTMFIHTIRIRTFLQLIKMDNNVLRGVLSVEGVISVDGVSSTLLSA